MSPKNYKSPVLPLPCMFGSGAKGARCCFSGCFFSCKHIMEQTKNLEQQNCRHKTITVIRLWAGFSGTIKKNLHMASLFGTCLQETWISNTHLLVEDGTQLTLTEKFRCIDISIGTVWMNTPNTTLVMIGIIIKESIWFYLSGFQVKSSISKVCCTFTWHILTAPLRGFSQPGIGCELGPLAAFGNDDWWWSAQQKQLKSCGGQREDQNTWV